MYEQTNHSMSLNIFIQPLYEFQGEECVCVCLWVWERVKVSMGQFEKSHVGNDRGPLHPSWLSLDLLEGNLDGCYQNESEERPILRAINIEPKSAEKWQMWFRSDLSLQVFGVLTAVCPNPPPSPLDTDRWASVTVSQSQHVWQSVCPSQCIALLPLNHFRASISELFWVSKCPLWGI